MKETMKKEIPVEELIARDNEFIIKKVNYSALKYRASDSPCGLQDFN